MLTALNALQPSPVRTETHRANAHKAFCGARQSWAKNAIGGRIVAFASELNSGGVDVESLPVPEGNLGLPVLGEQLEAAKDPDFAIKRIRKYGPIFKTGFLGNKTIFICGIDNLQEAMTELSDGLLGWDTWAMKMTLGDKALTRLNGEEHRFVRKAAYPAFNGTAIDSYVPSIAERAASFLEKWAGQESILFNAQAKDFAFAITAKSIVGMSYGDYTEEEVLEMFNIWWKGFFSVPLNLPFTKFGRTVKARRQLGKLIQENIERAKDGGVPDGKALSIMLSVEDENGNRVSDAQLEDTIFSVIMAGYDTTASAMSAVLLQLARHPEVLAKVRAEQEEVVSKFGSEITAQSLRATPYLEAVIKEAMRVTPVIGGGFRVASRTMPFKGFKIPKGWGVSLSIAPTIKHLDERWLDDADFNPERFLTEDGMKAGAYIPFGIGPHLCLGKNVAMAEMAIVFALIARGYGFEVEDMHPEYMYLPLPEPKDGLPVRFSKRGGGAS